MGCRPSKSDTFRRFGDLPEDLIVEIIALLGSDAFVLSSTSSFWRKRIRRPDSLRALANTVRFSPRAWTLDAAIDIEKGHLVKFNCPKRCECFRYLGDRECSQRDVIPRHYRVTSYEREAFIYDEPRSDDDIIHRAEIIHFASDRIKSRAYAIMSLLEAGTCRYWNRRKRGYSNH